MLSVVHPDLNLIFLYNNFQNINSTRVFVVNRTTHSNSLVISLSTFVNLSARKFNTKLQGYTRNFVTIWQYTHYIVTSW